MCVDDDSPVDAGFFLRFTSGLALDGALRAYSDPAAHGPAKGQPEDLDNHPRLEESGMRARIRSIDLLGVGCQRRGKDSREDEENDESDDLARQPGSSLHRALYMGMILTWPSPMPALRNMMLIQLCLKRCILLMAEAIIVRREAFSAVEVAVEWVWDVMEACGDGGRVFGEEVTGALTAEAAARD